MDTKEKDKEQLPKVERVSILVKTVPNCKKNQVFTVPTFTDWDVIAAISEFLVSTGGHYVNHIMTEYWQKPTKGKYGISYHYVDLKYYNV